MSDEDFNRLIKEIDSMTPEEYSRFHELACKMKSPKELEEKAECEQFKLNKIVDKNTNKLKPYEIPILVFGCLVGLAYIITGIIF